MTRPLLDALRAAPHLADAQKARDRLGDLLAVLDADPDAAPLAAALGSDSPARALVLSLADHSPFLWGVITREPARLVRLLGRPAEASQAALVAAQGGAGAPGTPREAVAAGLRRNRAEHALLVALADLGAVWSLEEVTGALAAFADASVNAALDAALHEAAASGRFRPADPADPQAGSGLIVLGMGKLGADELNYSSDIDLIVFFDADAAPLREGVEATPFFSRLAQSMGRLLQERTADGYVHRVDYRLRPDPGATPTAVSLASAYSYYETVGQNWERAAFIKARPVAGDLPRAEAFLAELRPFVWRKYFDFASIADVHAMKRQIHAVRGHGAIAVAGHDIKLGRGGIREVEFFVQTQQLVFGGRRPSLRGRRTLEMLPALHDEGWITPEARDELAEAYRFLRTVEHRLQMVADEQTQRLPEEPQRLDRFARFCGYRDAAAFGEALVARATRVQAHYALLFEAGPDLSAEVGDLVFTGVEDDPATLATLRRLGFRNPERAVETVRGWHFGRRPAVTSPRAREVVTELVPALIQALAGTADPDGALAALDRAFGRMPAAVELLTILRSHDRLRLLFADLLGTAPRLADTVAFSPHVLDAVIDPAFGEPVTDEAALRAQVQHLIGRTAAYEDFLDRTRDAARQLRFVTGARLLSGILPPAGAGRAYAGIAQAAVAETLHAVREAFAAEHGRVPGGRVVVLGLGRLGSRQLTADSDLDLVVLYDFDPEQRESDGRRPLDAAVYHNRLTQRLVAALTVPTRRGRLYEVDLRLRPGGGQGPIAGQWQRFLPYQREEADLWEHMALTRARALAGDSSLAAEASAAVAAVVGSARDPATVAREVRTMRALIAREKRDGGPFDLKLAPGGLLDLDFLAQALVLTHAAAHPGLIGLDAPAVLARAGDLGLVDPGDAATLGAAYQLLDDVHHWQRLMVEGPFDKGAAPATRLRLAAAAGLPDEAALLTRLAEVRAEVRALFERLLAE
ncbi:bifunctional [glutamine synthetase] adenylyltransferase/[glutamine synthetase]-adenylyl-L-tyrosine phosphorylase [Methylobacterium isbiliense]|uniref:bifunctional [glutamine synthetase] adenylyltransferase/[glutamine synthetase]-adenylyl-L-tyrosine phosphorylase n=1 Tax=Methylobacterium isbiliense TaxID=315478 RepID=UPI0025B4885F|nr:bifunctional [glutamine synthetase] adenylyltransferase/[glutamine synthetase]-adenylyl-L-tyrosine phosphorylase [Methylobacterium isbiliense]MDN3624272.1 bifunctional [glutamine synthetase] adenylyltransferase/[glutamine synthetase]-adenylyl-L-tyrosine phosphorylase [Methylobacterium isbiliense]